MPYTPCVIRIDLSIWMHFSLCMSIVVVVVTPWYFAMWDKKCLLFIALWADLQAIKWDILFISILASLRFILFPFSSCFVASFYVLCVWVVFVVVFFGTSCSIRLCCCFCCLKVGLLFFSHFLYLHLILLSGVCYVQRNGEKKPLTEIKRRKNMLGIMHNSMLSIVVCCHTILLLCDWLVQATAICYRSLMSWSIRLQLNGR